jgi:endonuclease/exonuclease/phosphatase family metal-dependent hydrolase
MKDLQRRSIILFFLSAIAGWATAQNDTLKVMSYNVLRFPEGNSNKAPILRTIINYVQPDVIGLQELTEPSAIDSLRKYAFDTSIYDNAAWVQETELMTNIFYNKNKLQLQRQISIATQPRRTNVYTFYSKTQNFQLNPDTVFFTCMNVHFKSSTGTDNESQRAVQAADIRIYIDNRPPGGNYMLLGDLNLYNASEPAWINLLEDGPNKLNDPINRIGNWSNNASFSDVHTQSPRTASFDLGVTGGLDDRFDFILPNDAIMDGRFGVRYLEDTYFALGNDGQHFNKSIIAAPTNTSAPDSVIQALHDFADHLPVIMDIELDYNNGFNATNVPAETWCNFQALQSIELKIGDSISWTDMRGATWGARSENGKIQTPIEPGLYVLNYTSTTGKGCKLKIQVIK